ncbi:MAG: hypothetical protein BGO51_08540 [Rhodospirillales bacterium 69-11]|jgi:uncharacterized protein YjiS (DUF1127 family)|nr:DUF1127 domain-containing protein [Rhodospirillales bacterium]OJW25982.1 MAG: hypothetical protein BGO51_08540 [Rhodospirillales bacterium 69-11]
MAAVTHLGSAKAHAPVSLGWTPIRRALDAWAERRARTRQLRDLAAFSDRELWDVGLSRGDLLAVEKGTFRRD